MRVLIAPDATRLDRPEHVRDLRDATVVGIDSRRSLLIQRHGYGAADRAIIAVNWVWELRQRLGPPAASLPR
jgi:hypothetical protein